MPMSAPLTVIYSTTPPQIARLGQLWMDTSVVPGVLNELIAVSPITYQAIASGGTSSGRLIGFQKLTGSGTYTHTAGAASAYVVAIGPGGGGAGGDFTLNPQAGGGGAGATAQKYITGLAASYAFACGTGGPGGAAGNNAGANGSASTTFGAVLTAPAGQGAPANGYGGVQSAIATGGDINQRGQSGYVAGSTLSGNAQSGAGGSTAYGTGGGAIPNNTGNDDAGNAATGFGAGGGGACVNLANRAGGNGSDGVILVWEYS